MWRSSLPRLLVTAALMAVAACSGGEEATDRRPDPVSETSESGAEAPEAGTTEPETDEPETVEPQTTEPDAAADSETAGPEAGDAAPAPARRPPPQDGPVDENLNWLGGGEMSADGIELFWSEVNQARRQELHRVVRPEPFDADAVLLSDDTIIYDGPELSFTDTGVESGARYVYFMAVQTATGDWLEPRWTERDAVDDVEPPSVVEDLTLTRQDDGAVLIEWDESTDNYRFDAYEISRADDGGAFEFIDATFGAERTALIDDQIPETGELTYQVLSRDFHGNRSEPVSASVSVG